MSIPSIDDLGTDMRGGGISRDPVAWRTYRHDRKPIDRERPDWLIPGYEMLPPKPKGEPVE